MSQWFNTSTSPALPQWKLFITAFQQTKRQQPITPQQIKFSLQPKDVPCLANIQQFLSNVSVILNEVKSYNNQMTDFVRSNAPLLIKQAIRAVLQVPESTQSTQRKHKHPLQGIQFIQGLMYLPNVFNINLLNEELYQFYCKAIVHYFMGNLAKMQEKGQWEEYQHAIYKNYFFRLFELPYAVVECQTRIGANYSSMTTASNTNPTKKLLSFLQTLITTISQTPLFLDSLITHISSESILNCLSKILMTNGMYNYPFTIKEQVLRKLFQTKKRYVERLSGFMNGKIGEREFFQAKEQVELGLENVLELETSVVNRSANIYDGIKLFQMVGNMDNVKDIVYLASVNIVWTNRHPSHNPIIPSFLEQHFTQLLLSIIHKDTTLYKSSSPTIELQPKINLNDINLSIQPLLLSLKELLSDKITKPQLKHLNLVKILYVMVLNRQKYEILQNIIIKHGVLGILVDVCRKFNQMDVLVCSVMDVFRSIFRNQVNLLILPPNAPNLQEFKNRNDIIEEKIVAEAFKAGDAILAMIKNMKSHKDPMFGHFFKLAKVIKEFSRNFFSTIETSTCMQMSSSSSIQIQSSVNLNILLEPMYRNEYIKAKCKEWQDFYMANFIQLENNYLRDLGKFEEFEKAPPQSEMQYTVVRFGEEKDVTQSQAFHDKAEVEATIKNSIEILSLKKEEAQKQQAVQTNIATTALNFKKDKTKSTISSTPSGTQPISQSSTTMASKPLSAQLITKEEIEITSEPIKIEFKRKKTETEEEAENDSASEETSVEEGEESFKNFMKKKLDEITTQNRQNQRKKSRTPTKFKSDSSKTPPKLKKWGTSEPEHPTIPKQLSPKHKSSTSLQQNNKSTANVSVDEKLERLKQRIQQNKPGPIRIIKVKKLPPVYKERVVDPNGRDARLMAWIRG